MNKRAEQVMSAKLVHIGWNSPVSQAFSVMQKHRLRHLPVLDDEADLIGIISDRDVQRAMKSELVWEEAIKEKIPSFDSVEFDPDARVRHYMSWPVKSVDRKTDLRIVAGMMVTDKISAVLVTEGDRPIGIVTSEDLLKVLMGVLGEVPLSKGFRIEALLGREGPFASLQPGSA